MNEEKMVMVKWHDARFYSGTYPKEDCEKHNMCLFESIGYVLRSDKTTTRIAAERNDLGEYRDITLIPTGSIISIKELIFILKEQP